MWNLAGIPHMNHGIPHRNQTCVPCIGRRIPIHCTTREVLSCLFDASHSSLCEVGEFLGYPVVRMQNFHYCGSNLNYLFIFNWRIIALQYRVGFCHTSTWISHRCTYVPSFLNLLLPPFFFLIFIYLAAPGLGCNMRDLVPWPGVKPRPSALGARSLSYWTTREVPLLPIFNCNMFFVFLLLSCMSSL